MTLISEKIIQTLLPGKILAVQVGVSRTAVLAETDAGLRCGLAATLSNPEFDHQRQPRVRNAGRLLEMPAADLAGLIDSPSFTEVSIGVAAINALLPLSPDSYVELNAEEYLAQQGVGKNLVVVGHFPFINRLKPCVKNLWVLELNPQEGDFPAQAAPVLIPQADLVAITATTLINHTFDGLIDLCKPGSKVMLLGPSTPLSPILFDFGVDLLCGTVVVNPEVVMLGISQGASLGQLRQTGGIKMVTIDKDTFNPKPPFTSHD